MGKWGKEPGGCRREWDKKLATRTDGGRGK